MQQKSIAPPAPLKKSKTNISVVHGSANHSTVESTESRETSSGTSSQSKSDKHQLEQVLVEPSVPKESADQIKEKCKERGDIYKKEIKKNMPLSDQLDTRDPQNIAELAQEVFLSMLEKEN